jgi:CDP-diacylglycerol---glycerol-3-phosphate 3-phosphatidyltransferase
LWYNRAMFSRLLQQRARQFVASLVHPLARLGITPNMVTLLGLLLSVLTALVIASGYMVIGGALVLFAGIFDMFDGAIARIRDAATTFGAFLDSTLDRYSESIILGGLLFYALQRPGSQEALWPFAYEQQWMIVLIFVATVGSLMVSYTKARAEGLGLECKTGLLARPERVVILAIGLLTGTTIWALMLLAILSHVTAIERIVHVWRATNSHVKQLAVDGLAQLTDSDRLDHRSSIKPNELKDPLVSSVPTSLPPLTGSVPQD